MRRYSDQFKARKQLVIRYKLIAIVNASYIDVPSHTGILPIRVWAVPYAYGQPIRVLAAHMRTGSPYTRMGQNSCFAHMRMSAHMRIGILDHTSIATAMT